MMNRLAAEGGCPTVPQSRRLWHVGDKRGAGL